MTMKYSKEFCAFCDDLKVKLTSLRREILHILWCAKKPLKAYDILEALLKSKPNSKPPTVYRALIFFLTQGVVHKIESIQSYTICSEPEKQRFSEILMVCDDCHKVSETHDDAMQSLVAELANNERFQLRQDVIELKGLCKNCSDSNGL